MATIELKENQWKKFSKADFAVIDCYGDQCMACVMLAPVFDAVADEMPGVEFGRINISRYPEIGREYNITAMPTLLFFRKGKKVHEIIGSMERESLLEQMARLLYQ